MGLMRILNSWQGQAAGRQCNLIDKDELENKTKQKDNKKYKGKVEVLLLLDNY